VGASTAPAAMIVVQEVHDRVMRLGIQRFAGYEIHTQGDSFEAGHGRYCSSLRLMQCDSENEHSHAWR
jgi:hypothetical protein